MRQVRITFEDKDFKKLTNMKESNQILGKCSSWEDFILRLAKIRKKNYKGGKSENDK